MEIDAGRTRPGAPWIRSRDSNLIAGLFDAHLELVQAPPGVGLPDSPNVFRPLQRHLPIVAGAYRDVASREIHSQAKRAGHAQRLSKVSRLLVVPQRPKPAPAWQPDDCKKQCQRAATTEDEQQKQKRQP